jgi:hypothetical protein
VSDNGVRIANADLHLTPQAFEWLITSLGKCVPQMFAFPSDGVKINPSAAGLLRQAEGCPSEPLTGNTSVEVAAGNYFWFGCGKERELDLATSVDLLQRYALPHVRANVRAWANASDVGADDVLTVHIRHGDIMGQFYERHR